MRRRTSGRPGTGLPPRALVHFDPREWPDDGPVPGGGCAYWPPDLAGPMRAWCRWNAARQAWVDEHGWWPTGAVERWVELRAARPGGAR